MSATVRPTLIGNGSGLEVDAMAALQWNGKRGILGAGCPGVDRAPGHAAAGAAARAGGGRGDPGRFSLHAAAALGILPARKTAHGRAEADLRPRRDRAALAAVLAR